MKIHTSQVDAFTHPQFSDNPTIVFLLENELEQCYAEASKEIDPASLWMKQLMLSTFFLRF